MLLVRVRRSVGRYEQKEEAIAIYHPVCAGGQRADSSNTRSLPIVAHKRLKSKAEPLVYPEVWRIHARREDHPKHGNRLRTAKAAGADRLSAFPVLAVFLPRPAPA